jgi:hypothetical protein
MILQPMAISADDVISPTSRLLPQKVDAAAGSNHPSVLPTAVGQLPVQSLLSRPLEPQR